MMWWENKKRLSMA